VDPISGSREEAAPRSLIPTGAKLNHFVTCKGYLCNASIIRTARGGAAAEALQLPVKHGLSRARQHARAVPWFRARYREPSMMIAGRVQAFIATP
jgi:hypothetical protein